jgi:hypothetical protein
MTAMSNLLTKKQQLLKHYTNKRMVLKSFVTNLLHFRADIERADIDGLPPELGCLGLLDGVELLLLDLEGEVRGLKLAFVGGVELLLLPLLLLLWFSLGLESIFNKAPGGPIRVALRFIILVGFPPLPPLEGDFSPSLLRFLSFLSRSFSRSRSFVSESRVRLSFKRKSLYLLLSFVGFPPTGVMVSELGILDDGESLLKGMISIPGRRSKFMFGYVVASELV